MIQNFFASDAFLFGICLAVAVTIMLALAGLLPEEFEEEEDDDERP